MFKIRCFSNKFSKLAKRLEALGALRHQRPVTFNIGVLKLRDLAKLWIFKLIRSNFK